MISTFYLQQSFLCFSEEKCICIWQFVSTCNRQQWKMKKTTHIELCASVMNNDIFCVWLWFAVRAYRTFVLQRRQPSIHRICVCWKLNIHHRRSFDPKHVRDRKKPSNVNEPERTKKSKKREKSTNKTTKDESKTRANKDRIKNWSIEKNQFEWIEASANVFIVSACYFSSVRFIDAGKRICCLHSEYIRNGIEMSTREKKINVEPRQGRNSIAARRERQKIKSAASCFHFIVWSVFGESILTKKKNISKWSEKRIFRFAHFSLFFLSHVCFSREAVSHRFGWRWSHPMNTSFFPSTSITVVLIVTTNASTKQPDHMQNPELQIKKYHLWSSIISIHSIFIELHTVFVAFRFVQICIATRFYSHAWENKYTKTKRLAKSRKLK